MSQALWDWRRRTTALYAAVRAELDPQDAWQAWRDARDALFRTHDQTPLDRGVQSGFIGLPFFPYDPALRHLVHLDDLPPGPEIVVDAGPDGTIRMHEFARTNGLAAALGKELILFWIAGYGGGAFLPFADATCGHQTYGAGRYLLDTIKGADLGTAPDGRTVLDFNFAYNPSCCYSPRWVCPLAPMDNRLPAPVRAGEQAPC